MSEKFSVRLKWKTCAFEHYLHFSYFRGFSQIKNSVLNVNPTFVGGRGGIVYCCNVYILYLKSLSFDEVTELYFFLFISINNLIPIQTICFIQVLFIPMPIPIAVLILLKINLASLKKVKLISTFFQSHKITGAFYTLSIFVE